MNRRDFLQSGGIVSVSLTFAKAERLFSRGTTVDPWRTFQVTTRVEVLKPSWTTRVWVPLLVSTNDLATYSLLNTRAYGHSTKS